MLRQKIAPKSNMRLKLALAAVLCLFMFSGIRTAEAYELSVFTVLNHLGVGVEGIYVTADDNDIPPPLAYGYTDSEGKAYFDLPPKIDVRFKINYNCFSYESDPPITTPALETIGLPIPSLITVVGGAGAFVYVYDYASGLLLGSVRTDSQGDARCYVEGGTQFTFTIRYAGFIAYESGVLMAPVTQQFVQLPTPSSVTVLDGGNPVQGVMVYAYDLTDKLYGNAITNVAGQVNCYIIEGTNVKFVIKYQGFISGESNYGQTPRDVQLNLPAPSVVTITEGGVGIEGVRVYAYDSGGTELGYADTDVNGAVDCYLAEGQQVRFSFQYGDISYQSDLLMTPATLNVDLSSPSTMTILYAGAGVSGIEVFVYDINWVELASAFTDVNGVAVMHVDTGVQFRYKFDYLGYFYESGLVTAPYDDVVNLPQASTMTIRDHNSLGVFNVSVNAYDDTHTFIDNVYTDIDGVAQFHIPGSQLITFEFSYSGYSYASDPFTTPSDLTTYLPTPSTVTVLDGGFPLRGVFVYAYDRNGAGLGSMFTNGVGQVYFYLEAGTQTVFRAYYNSLYHYSDWIIAPQNTTIDIQSPIKPQSISSVKLIGNQFFVNDKHYKIKGVCYQPTPVGEFPWLSSWRDNTEILDRDFPILKNMNANTIRLWDRVTNTLMDSAEQHGIKVIAGYWIDPSIDYSDPAQRDTIKADFKQYVSDFKHKPALLCWAIGNAQNRDLQTDLLDDWYSLVNEMAYEALAEEGVRYHPVAVVNEGLDSIGDVGYGTDDPSMPYLDIWGTEILTGQTFGTYFDDYALLSSKPLWIATYGVDAFFTTLVADPVEGYEDEATQADWVDQSAQEVLLSDITIGGTVNEYSDEWWVAGDELNHDTGGWSALPALPDAFPDDYANVEYWGIAAISPDGADSDTVDDITLRQVYTNLKEIFRTMPFSTVTSIDSIQGVIDDPYSWDFIYVEEGTYVEDIYLPQGTSLVGSGNRENIIVNGRIEMTDDTYLEGITFHYELAQADSDPDFCLLYIMDGSDIIVKDCSFELIYNYTGSTFPLDYNWIARISGDGITLEGNDFSFVNSADAPYMGAIEVSEVDYDPNIPESSNISLLKNNIYLENTPSASSLGNVLAISFTETDGALIENNLIYMQGEDFIGLYGILFNRFDFVNGICDNVVVKNNTIYPIGNSPDSMYGIDIAYVDNINVRNNIVDVRAGEGIASNLYPCYLYGWDLGAAYDLSFTYNIFCGTTQFLYGDVPGGLVVTQHDNLNRIPRFVDKQNRDLHVRRGSPAIDKGDPNDPYSNEPAPRGGRINTGAYGNTSEATRSNSTGGNDDIIEFPR